MALVTLAAIRVVAARAAGTPMCVVPGIYILAIAALVLPVVAAEGTNVFGRCFGLFHRGLDAALGRAVLIGVVCFCPLAAAAIGLSVYEVLADLPEATGSLVLIAAGETVLLSVLGLVAGVLAPPLTLGMYADLRGIGEPTSAAGIAVDMGITATSPG